MKHRGIWPIVVEIISHAYLKRSNYFSELKDYQRWNSFILQANEHHSKLTSALCSTLSQNNSPIRLAQLKKLGQNIGNINLVSSEVSKDNIENINTQTNNGIINSESNINNKSSQRITEILNLVKTKFDFDFDFFDDISMKPEKKIDVKNEPEAQISNKEDLWQFDFDFNNSNGSSNPATKPKNTSPKETYNKGISMRCILN